MSFGKIIIVDTNKKRFNDLSQNITNSSLSSLSFSQYKQAEDILNGVQNIKLVICNCCDEPWPDPDFIKTIEHHKIPLIIFSDIPGVTHLNMYHDMNVTFSPPPTNKYFLNFLINEVVKDVDNFRIRCTKNRPLKLPSKHSSFKDVLYQTKKKRSQKNN